MRILVSDTLKE